MAWVLVAQGKARVPTGHVLDILWLANLLLLLGLSQVSLMSQLLVVKSKFRRTGDVGDVWKSVLVHLRHILTLESRLEIDIPILELHHLQLPEVLWRALELFLARRRNLLLALLVLPFAIIISNIVIIHVLLVRDLRWLGHNFLNLRHGLLVYRGLVRG